MRITEAYRKSTDYLSIRRKLLEIACGTAKNKYPYLIKVIGIGMDAPKFSGNTNSEDFICMPCETWSDEDSAYYEEQNKAWNFFGTNNLKEFHEHITRFVPKLSE